MEVFEIHVFFNMSIPEVTYAELSIVISCLDLESVLRSNDNF